MATPDPYLYWSGAPKHWVHVPVQRQGSPGPEQISDPQGGLFAPRSSAQGGLFAPQSSAQRPGSARNRASSRYYGEWSVAAIALAVAVAAFVLIGTTSAVPDRDVRLTEPTSDTSVQ